MSAARKRKQGVTVADLRDKYEGHVLLYCDECGAEYSATRGDYWALKADHVFTCDHGAAECEHAKLEYGDHVVPLVQLPPTNMRLVRRETRLVEVKT